ncbi:2OG-Fe(II) oxygenase [Spirosoma sp.]|uniref:2OG-Fe(II) oxygenase n=1 Tax=Spirosoma sp. TaxID=1899569 RepID=UPI0026188170|nr:2OG-Fe(II) oxygenase [Spirosoma sp.]MCX6212991.1 2OG-Fe(II) oxygenase [Spirosoma sp.]
MEPYFTTCPECLTLHRFLTDVGLSIPRRLVQQALTTVDSFPKISLLDFSRLLRGWGVTPYSLQLSDYQDTSLTGPLLTYCQTIIGPQFAVISEISDYVYYYTPALGDCKETIETFKNDWNGIVLVGEVTDRLGYSESDSSLMETQPYPDVRLIDNFLTQDECNQLITYAEQSNMFSRSQIQQVKQEAKIHVESTRRTSFSAFLPDRNNLLLASIYQKVADELNVPLTHIENIQCVRYALGQQFKPHYDGGNGYDRVHTILVYLNDDFERGETYFPEINMKIQPKAGRALYFRNLDNNLEIIPTSLHAGLPVDKGIKYGCNIWVRAQALAEVVSYQ